MPELGFRYATTLGLMRTIHGAWQRAARGAGLLATDGSSAPTIFAEMSELAARTGAINLGQGFPDTDGPQAVLAAAQRAIADGINQYPPGRGLPVLRQAIADHQQHWYSLSVNPDTEVLVTAGATEALAAVLLGLVDGPEDEVVVFEPYYDSYAACVALSGATLRTVPLRFPDFQPDLDELTRAVTDRTRIILVNDPHNPTGAVFSAEVREHIVRLAAEHDAIIVTDEVYEHLVFDGAKHVPIATDPAAAERTLTISSGGKTFRTTGWKVGWITGPAPLIDAVTAVKQFLTFTGSAPFQPAIAVGLGLDDTYFHTLASDMQAGRDILATALRGAGFAVSHAAGTYFTVADAAPLGVTNAREFCQDLAHRVGVVAIPLSAFVRDGARADASSLIRFAACKRPEVLHAAAERLALLTDEVRAS